MIKAALVVAIGLLALGLLRRRSAATRHWILACSLICAAVLPALELVVPTWHAPFTFVSVTPAVGGSPLAFGDESEAVQRMEVEAVTVATSPSPVRVLLSLAPMFWGAGVVVCILLLSVGLARLARILAQASPIDSGPWADALADLSEATGSTSVTLLQSQHPTHLFTWGLRRPAIVLPAGASSWPDPRIRAVLGHELAHVRRRDWAVQMLAEVVRAVHWFNPLVWFACQRLRQTSEQACDDAVLREGMDAPDYASHLLEVARTFRQSTHHSLLPVMTMIRPSSFETRVRAMLNPGIDRSPISRITRGATAAALVLLTIPLAGLTTQSRDEAPMTASVGRDIVMAAPAAVEPASPAARPVPSQPAVTSTPTAAEPTTRVGAPPKQTAPSAPAAIAVTVLDAAGRTMPDVVVAIVKKSIALTQVTTPAGEGKLAVTVTQKPSEQRIEMRTGADGRAEANGLQPWDYDVECSKPGFKRNLLKVSLKSGESIALKVVMQIGSLQETIVIAAPSMPGQATAPTPKRMAETPTTSDPCDSSPSGGCVTPPRKLVDMRPVYPPAMAANGVSADVVVKATVGLDGILKDFQAETGPDAAFVQALLDALRQWQFSPVKLNGVPQECQVTVIAKFVAGKN